MTDEARKRGPRLLPPGSLLEARRGEAAGREGDSASAPAAFVSETVSFHLALEGLYYTCFREDAEKLSQ